MPRLVETLQRHSRVGIDTSLFIYELEHVDPFALPARIVFRAVMEGDITGVTSVLTLMELTVRPLRLGRHDLAEAYWRILDAYPRLEILPVDADAAKKAAELRAVYGLSSMDAIQVATSLNAGATAFLTNDAGLRRIGDLDVLLLDEYLTP